MEGSAKGTGKVEEKEGTKRATGMCSGSALAWRGRGGLNWRESGKRRTRTKRSRRSKRLEKMMTCLI